MLQIFLLVLQDYENSISMTEVPNEILFVFVFAAAKVRVSKVSKTF